MSAGRDGMLGLGSGSGLAPSLLHSQVAAITASRAEAQALGARLREAEAAQSTAEAEVAALHDQAAVRAAEGDRCVRPHIKFRLASQERGAQRGLRCTVIRQYQERHPCQT